jgi:hypothetical protein
VAVVQYTFIHKQYTERHKTKNIEQHKNFGIVRAVPRVGELYPGICLSTEEKARKNLSQGGRTIRIHTPNNKKYINYSIKQEYNHILIKKIEPKEYERM